MQDFPLTIGAVLRHGRAVYGDAECVTWTESGPRRATYATVADNAGRAANALARLGIQHGDRVGTFMWNSQEHMEVYLAIPSMGAVVAHTEHPPVSRAARVRHQSRRGQGRLRRRFARTGARQSRLGAHDGRVLRRRRRRRMRRVAPRHRPPGRCATPNCSRKSHPNSPGPRSTNGKPSAMCYTSGTTGNPKGVVVLAPFVVPAFVRGDNAQRVEPLGTRPRAR